MARVEDSKHFFDQADIHAQIHRSVADIPGVVAVAERDESRVRPSTTDHYVEQFRVTREDDTVALIDIHHFGKTGLKAIFPTIVRLNEKSNGTHQTDIFSIDANGYVLAHTNMSGADREESRDNSIERLIPYEGEIMERVQRLPIEPRFRIEKAFDLHRTASQG